MLELNRPAARPSAHSGARFKWLHTGLLVVVGLMLPLAAAAQESTDGAQELATEDGLLDEDEAEVETFDPLEPGNRAVFGFNEIVYSCLFDPISSGYRFLFPGLVRRSIGRFFSNLNEPVRAVNYLLRAQGRPAGVAATRFLTNTTVGLAGLFDPATAWGLEKREADFGETLAVYGLGSGLYLVLPVLGPSTARDAVGQVVDALLRPDTWLLGTGPRFVLATGSGISSYEIEREHLEELRRSSVDFYAAIRIAYLLDRAARVRLVRGEDGKAPAEPELSP